MGGRATSQLRRVMAGALAVVVVAGTAAVVPPTVAAVEGGTVAPASVTAPTPTPARVGPPRSMSVIGDSISAGTGADGNASGILDLLDAGQEQPENSWATGTRGGLDTIYQRLLNIQPAIEGKNNRRAVNGADMSDAPGQANAVPTGTEYVLIQMGGNDLCKSNESQMSSVADYRTRFTSTLTNIWNRSPNALVYVASIPDIYNLWYLRGAPNPPNPNTSSKATGIVGARTFWSGSVIGISIGEFPCQSLLRDATSYPGPAEERRLRVRQRNIELNEVLAAECAKHKFCRFDDYALFNFSSNRVWDGPGPAPTSAPLKPAGQFEFTDGDISGLDHFHPSLSGQRKLADIAWRTSFDFSDATAPAVSVAVGETVQTGNVRRVSMGATDAAGVRAIEYRTHLPTGVSAWQTVLDTEQTSVDVPNLTTELAWVETRAIDRNGNLSASTVTTVYPLPGAPTGPTFSQTVQNGVEGMRVIWRSPSDESGTRGQIAPTVAYEVTASPGGQTCRTEAASLDPTDLANIEKGCLVSGLSYGQTYAFTVRAITQGGPGAAATARLGTLSGPTSAAYVGPSGPVGGVTVTPDGANLVVRWSPPTDLGGGPLKGYEVTAVRRGSGASPTELCGTTQAVGKPPTYFTATQCTLRNPVRLAEYDVEVRAITEISTSPFTTKPTLRSDAAEGSGWLPEVPVLASEPTAEVSAVERKATVRWSPFPESQLAPGATVTVTAQPGGSSCTVPAAVTSCELSGLGVLVPYRFNVVVNNGAGTADDSVDARLVASTDEVAPFADIDPENFAAVPARWLRANGVTTGVGGGDNFDPRGGVTRAEMAAFLWRFAGQPESPTSCGFRDEGQIPTFARRGACWLKSTGITENNPFNPNGAVTREQMAAFLWRFADRPGSPASCGFEDAPTIPSYARQGACWLKATGITDNNPYKPKGAVTRGQMAAFLFRLHGELNPQGEPPG